jgi:hypothetical protein
LGPFKNVYGMGVSPVLADDVMVFVIDQDKNPFIVAVGRSDGKVRWQKPRPEALSGASTPERPVARSSYEVIFTMRGLRVEWSAE